MNNNTIKTMSKATVDYIATKLNCTATKAELTKQLKAQPEALETAYTEAKAQQKAEADSRKKQKAEELAKRAEALAKAEQKQKAEQQKQKDKKQKQKQTSTEKGATFDKSAELKKLETELKKRLTGAEFSVSTAKAKILVKKSGKSVFKCFIQKAGIRIYTDETTAKKAKIKAEKKSDSYQFAYTAIATLEQIEKLYTVAEVKQKTGEDKKQKEDK